jgi:hypothetical protein
MGNRSRIEIVSMILDAANGGGEKDKNYILCFSKLWTIKGLQKFHSLQYLCKDT